MIKYKMKISCMIAFCFTMLGCSEKISDNPQKNTPFKSVQYAALQRNNNRIAGELNDKFKVDAVIKKPENIQNQMEKWSAAIHQFEAEQVADVLFADRKREDFIYTSSNIFGEERMEVNYYDGNTVFTCDYGINFMTEESKYFDYHFTPYLFETKKDLKFMNEEKGKNNVESVLKKLGLQNYRFATTYYMDKPSLENSEEIKSADPYFQEDLDSGKALYKGNWEDEDECYVFDLIFVNNGLSILSSDYLINDSFLVPGSDLRVFYSKDGVIQLKLRAVYDTEKEMEKIEILEPENIIYIMEEKYSGLIQSDPVEIKELELIYLPRREKQDGSEMSLIPVWRVNLVGKPVEEREQAYQFYNYYDGGTGEELLI